MSGMTGLAEEADLIVREGLTAVVWEEAHLGLLDAVVNGLFHVGLSLQDALELPADPARKRIEEALDDLDDVVREIRGTVFAARDRPAPPCAPRR